MTHRSEPDWPLHPHIGDDPEGSDGLDDGNLELRCHRCGQPLVGDPDDDPAGGPFGQPICGRCDQRRNDETAGVFGPLEW